MTQPLIVYGLGSTGQKIVDELLDKNRKKAAA